MLVRKSIDVLSKLLEINRHRLSSYISAAQETNETELKLMFQQFAANSKQCNDELTFELDHLGADNNKQINRFDRFYQYWNEIKSALLTKNRKALLNFCTSSESSVLETYNTVLTKDIDYLTIEQHKMIYKQYVLVKHDYEQVQLMQNLQLESA